MRTDFYGDGIQAARAMIHLHEALPFDDGEGMTVAAVAAAVGCDEEETMEALVTAACAGWVETNLTLWRPRAETKLNLRVAERGER